MSAVPPLAPPPVELVELPPDPQAPSATTAAVSKQLLTAFVNTSFLLVDLSLRDFARLRATLSLHARDTQCGRADRHDGRLVAKLPPRPRWATFDCYGTLVDWNGGIGRELTRLFGAAAAEMLLERYHEFEPEVEARTPNAPYREVMATTLRRVAETEGLDLAEDEADALGRSLPDWPVFEEVPGALTELREHGWRLAILSNTDREFIDASMESIGVEFDLAVVASEIRSYKPAPGHWEAFFASTGADATRHVHVAASLFHDVVPAGQMSIPCVWINRLGESPSDTAAAELPDLSRLPQELEHLVPEND
jgi:2-haloacid dehalogenase